jgi:hypothetical protein
MLAVHGGLSWQLEIRMAAGRSDPAARMQAVATCASALSGSIAAPLAARARPLGWS